MCFGEAVQCYVQVAQESLTLSRVVRAFGTEEKESNRYIRCLAAHLAPLLSSPS